MIWHTTIDNKKKEPLFNKNEASVVFNIGFTHHVNKLLIPMIENFIIDRLPISVLIQKENTQNATVYIATKDNYNFLILDTYNFGKVCTGSLGLEEILLKLGVPTENIKYIYDPKIKGYIEYHYI